MSDINRKRKRGIYVRCSDEEYARVQERKNSTGQTMQSFIVNAALGAKVTSAEEIAEIKRDSLILASMDRQLRGMATNINQLAYKANSFGEIPSARELEEILREIRGFRKEVNDKIKDGLACVTGPFPYEHLTWDTANRAFLTEKTNWNKDTGRMCVHNIISFHKDENITPEQAFSFGKEFAEKWFPDHQTVVAVHQDKEHVHIHLVTNTVSWLDGMKLHSTKKDLERMKEFTNEMCLKRGLGIAQKGQHFDGTPVEDGDPISWDREKYRMVSENTAKSYVVDCFMAVIRAKKGCADKDEFIKRMSAQGWDVNWTEKRKHVTFKNENGERVRDTNLSKTFSIDISKEALSHEFTQNYETRRKRMPEGREPEAEGECGYCVEKSRGIGIEM